MLTAADCDEILHQFPPVVAAFAYGSGVIEQAGYANLSNLIPSSTESSSLPMVDLIFVVSDWSRLTVIFS